MFSPGNVLLYEAPALTLSNLIAKGVQLFIGNSTIHVSLYLGGTQEGHVIIESLSSGGVKIKILQEDELYSRKDGLRLKGIAK